MEFSKICPEGRAYFKYNINGNLFNRPRTKHQCSSVSDFEFADDAVLIALSHHTSQLALDLFTKVAADFGLSVSFTKTKSVVLAWWKMTFVLSVSMVMEWKMYNLSFTWAACSPRSHGLVLKLTVE